MEEAYKISENTIINFQHLPSQARWKTATFEIIRESLKGVKDLSYLVENEDTADDALGYLTNIRRFLKGSVPQKSGISLEPTKSEPKRKSFSSFVLLLRKKKEKYWWYGEAQLSKKYGNVTIVLPKITRPNPIKTETVILEDPLPEEKQQEDFDLSIEEKREELQLHINLEVNTLPDKEIRLIKGNRILTDFTAEKCEKILENQFQAQNEL